MTMAENTSPPADRRLTTVVHVVGVACFGALLTGIAHFSILLVRRYVLGSVTFAGADIVWMAPLGYLVAFLIAAMPLSLLALLAPRLPVWRIAVLVISLLAAFAMLLLFRQLLPYAALLLAAGVATRMAYAAGPEPAPWIRRMRRPGIAMAAVVLLATLVVRVGPRLRASWWSSRAPAPPAESPNVLLLVLDAVRAENLGLYGYARHTTPALERWAQSGVVFDWAIAPSSWTLPSHSSLFTGLPAGQLSPRWTRQLDGKHRTLAEVLRGRGYATGGFVANYWFGCPETGLARGFTHYECHVITGRQILRSTTLFQTHMGERLVEARSIRAVLRAIRSLNLKVPDIPDESYMPVETVAQAFLRWEAKREQRPFFAFLNFLDVHERQAPQPYRTRFADRPNTIDRYDASIAYTDSIIDGLLDSLRVRGVLDRTIVAITADHGELFDASQASKHGTSLYMPVLRVPLLLRYPPRVPEGRRIEVPVSLQNLAATILDLAGVTGSQLPGETLARTWTDTGVEPLVLAELERHVNPRVNGPSSRGALRSIVDARWHYIRHYIKNEGGFEELFAYRDDPQERTNLKATPEGISAVRRFRAVLDRIPTGY